MKLKHYITAGAAGLMVLLGGQTQAALVAAYEDASLGPSWQHTVTFSNQTGTSVDIAIDTFYFDNIVPILKLFETDGVAGSITVTETITNTGSVAWNGWSESIWDESSGVYGPFNPGPSVSWSSVSSSRAGTASIDAGLGVAEFIFSTPVLQGETFTLTKTFSYGSGVYAVEIAEIPSAVPVPAALPLLLSGLAGLGAVARKKKAA